MAKKGIENSYILDDVSVIATLANYVVNILQILQANRSNTMPAQYIVDKPVDNSNIHYIYGTITEQSNNNIREMAKSLIYQYVSWFARKILLIYTIK